jgi:hypothetical protein
MTDEEFTFSIKHVSWGVLLSFVTWGATIVGTIVGVAWALSQDRTQVLNRITAIENTSEDHELRMRRLEETTQGIATDVKWIRTAIERGR